MISAPILPPTHLIDAPGVFISPADPAWDHSKIEAELDELRQRAARPVRETIDREIAAGIQHDPVEADRRVAAAAIAEAGRHPVARFFGGLTRFQVDADDWKPSGEPTRARAYLREGVTPATFTLVRPNRRRQRQAEAVVDTWERRESWIRAVVRGVGGPEGALAWTPKDAADEVPDEVLEALYRWSPALVRQLADACAAYCAPLREFEGKH